MSPLPATRWRLQRLVESALDALTAATKNR